MGAFYGGVHIRADEREPVVDAIRGLAKRKWRFLISPVFDGWVSVFPNLNGQDDKVSKAIAKRVDADRLHLAIHDDDLLYYWFYQRGKLIDKYSSCPDYFGGISDRAKARWQGKPDLLEGLLPNSDARPLQELLDGMRSGPLFSSELPQRLPALLGIRNAWTAYEYLIDGETDDIAGWDEFVHLPDLSKEQKRQQRIEADIARRKRVLRRDGQLVGTIRGRDRRSRTVITADNSDLGFLVCWTVYNQPPIVQRLAPPWSEPRSVGMEIGPDVYVMQTSKSGRYLATGHASGNWKACLWDLSSERMLWEIGQRRVVSWVGFVDQERQLVSLSENQATIIDVADGSALATCEYDRFQGSYIAGATHEGSKTLVVGGQMGLTIIDLNTCECQRTFPVVRHDPMSVIRGAS